MAEIKEAGYKNLRKVILDNWKALELRTPEQTPIKRWVEGTDSQLVWTKESTVNSDELTLELTIKGSDVGASKDKPVSIGYTAIFTTGKDSALVALEDFDEVVTFSSESDELVLQHTVQVPKLD